MEPYRLAAVRRPHAKQVTLRLTMGATGHEEGQASVSRSSPSGPRAPTWSQRSWLVARVAEAPGVVLHPSRRHVARNTEAAAGPKTRHCFAAKRGHAVRSAFKYRWGSLMAFAACPRAPEMCWESPLGRACSRAVPTTRVLMPCAATATVRTLGRGRAHVPAWERGEWKRVPWGPRSASARV